MSDMNEKPFSFKGLGNLIIFALFIFAFIGYKIGQEVQRNKCMSDVRKNFYEQATYEEAWKVGAMSAMTIMESGNTGNPQVWKDMYTQDSTIYFGESK